MATIVDELDQATSPANTASTRRRFILNSVSLAILWACVVFACSNASMYLGSPRAQAFLTIAMQASLAVNFVVFLGCLGRGFCREHLALLALIPCHGVLMNVPRPVGPTPNLNNAAILVNAEVEA